MGLASAGFVIAGLAPASGAPSAPAQEAFSNGTAKATASSLKIAPGVGSLELALKSGVAVAEVRNQLAQAESQALDMGLIGTTLTAEGCDGGDPTVPAEELPQPMRVDNRQGDASTSGAYAPVADTALAGGYGEVSASETPSARALAASATSSTPAMKINGGEAIAVAEIVDGAARQARATVTADVLLGGGVVNLGGMRWEALHRTGSDPKAEASFSLASNGLGIPVNDLAAVETGANEALKPFGISLEFPRVERIQEPNDLVRVTPLRISIKDSEVGRTVFGPVLDASREVRSELFNQLSAAVCDTAGALLVGDIGVSILAGTGFIRFEIGGAEAMTGELVLGNPFGNTLAPTGASVAPAGGFAPTSDSGSVGGVSTPVMAPAAGTPSAPTTQTKAVADVGPLKDLCETIHPGGTPSCSEGAMLPLGLAGLFATFGIGGFDWFQQRRKLSTLGVMA